MICLVAHETRPLGHVAVGSSLACVRARLSWVALLLVAACCSSADLAAERHARAVKALIELGAEVQDVVDEVSQDRGTYVTLFAEHLTFDGRIRDEILTHLREIQALFLNLTNTPVKDDAMPDLARLPNLKVLNVIVTRVSDRGLKLIAASRDLRLLKLNRTKITDDGLEALQEMLSLRFLYLGETSLTDAAMPHLAKLPQLEAIKLSRLPISDDGLRYLSEMPRLRYLALDGTAVTDAGLKHLELLPKLTYLDVQETSITPQAIADFRRRHPNCHIEE